MIQENIQGYPPRKPQPPCDCSDSDGCEKVGYQYADICVPVEIKPDAEIGRIETECCGEPDISCKQNREDCTCEVRIVQKICIKIPIRYSVEACKGESTIHCVCSCDESCT